MISGWLRSFKKIFINNKRQVRSGWKIAIMLFIFTAAFYSLSRFSYLISSTATLLAILAAARLIDKKAPRDIGFTSFFSSAPDFCIGLLAGAISISFVFIILLLSGSVHTSESLLRPSVTPALATGLLMFICTGFLEETFSRGYCITILRQNCSLPASIVISSVLFSLLHLGNLNISIIGLANIFLVGVLLSLMFIRTGSLWMPIGYHITWNYFQGRVFGFAVSGLEQSGMYSTKPYFNDILNGGSFGPEGGLAVTGIIAIGIIVELLSAGNRRKEHEGRNRPGQS